jgi:hypothetical protein
MAAIRAGGRRSYRLTGSSLLMHSGTRRSGLMAAIRAEGRRSYRACPVRYWLCAGVATP